MAWPIPFYVNHVLHDRNGLDAAALRTMRIYFRCDGLDLVDENGMGLRPSFRFDFSIPLHKFCFFLLIHFDSLHSNAHSGNN